jgi:hypothetical protein
MAQRSVLSDRFPWHAGGRVGDATTYVVSARELFDFAQLLMKTVAADPFAADRLKELPAITRRSRLAE